MDRSLWSGQVSGALHVCDSIDYYGRMQLTQWSHFQPNWLESKNHGFSHYSQTTFAAAAVILFRARCEARCTQRRAPECNIPSHLQNIVVLVVNL